MNMEIKVITVDSSQYPQRLLHTLGPSAPKALHCLGNTDLMKLPSIGFCGSRKASEKAIAATEDCASLIAESNIVIVSGNASGVDFIAHHTAMRSNANTILVLPEGINKFRIRKEFQPIWNWNRCLVISEFHPDAPWRNYQAMNRNNTIIGLSNAMIVMEAGITGGTRHAGESSLRFGVPLFVVEYRELDEHTEGNHELIRLGGRPIRRSANTGRASISGILNAALENFGENHRQGGLNL